MMPPTAQQSLRVSKLSIEKETNVMNMNLFPLGLVIPDLLRGLLDGTIYTQCSVGMHCRVGNPTTIGYSCNVEVRSFILHFGVQ